MLDVPAAADVVIIGGGFAGVATAWALARRGVTDVVVVEREPELGRHASGRGAGLGRQLADDDHTTALTVRGAQLLRTELAAAWQPTAGIVGFADADSEREYVARAARFEVAAELLSARELAARFPALADARVRSALYVPGDGAIDVRRLLLEMHARVDARVLVDTPVLAIEPGVVRTARGAIGARVVVEATGAWAGQLLGALPPTVVKRHIFVLDPPLEPSPSAPAAAAPPWLWQLGAREVYRRVTADGVLTSPCDAITATAGDYTIDPAAEAALRDRLAAHSPDLAGAHIASQWACVRTFTGDRRMKLARDRERPWLVWAIGLGGHGATAAPAVGETVAAAVVDALAST